jgi:hypothetical protein
MESGDFAMPGYVLIKKSQSAWDARDAARMLGLAEAAQEGPWRLPWRVMAEAVQQRVRGLAMTQASRRKVDDTLKRARELLERGAGDAANPIAAHYDGQLFKLQTAICYAESGRPDAATEIYEETLKPEVFSARDIAYFSVLKAQVLVSVQPADDAASTGMAAFGTAPTGPDLRPPDQICAHRVSRHGRLIKPSTVQRSWSVLRSVLNEAHRLGLTALIR